MQEFPLKKSDLETEFSTLMKGNINKNEQIGPDDAFYETHKQNRQTNRYINVISLRGSLSPFTPP